MKDRINQFLAHEGISPAEFADKIGVQRSSVSHVLNGRNYPSASFIQKMLGSYKTLNSRWLLLGEGTMFDLTSGQAKEPSLFQVRGEKETFKSPKEAFSPENRPVLEPVTRQTDVITVPPAPINNLNTQEPPLPPQSVSELLGSSLSEKEVERIVLFHTDKTFTAYTPSK